MNNDLNIARKITLKPIAEISNYLGISRKDIELYGNYKAKLSLDIIKNIRSKRRGTYIVVTGMTPTHLGEGKTVTTIGLSMALNKAGKKAICCIRQPSLGPFFGVKGGGVGGGRSQVLPAEDINLHLTGDIHAVSQAHNLAAAFLDNHLYRGNALGIDIDKIFWRRVTDTNDRPLRNVRVGLGGGESGVERDTGFDITAASEIMAILALSDSLADLRNRLARIVVALTKDGSPVTCEDLKVAGAMALILKDSLKPTIVQTTERTPCFIHTGPFANITHGNSSIIADRIALALSDYTITESGFGADCGLEKFVNIKCRYSGIEPDAIVLVCSIRAIKIHSGFFKTVVGMPLDKEVGKENLEALEAGFSNLVKQIENANLYGVPCVVAINRFSTDTKREIEFVRRRAIEKGAFDCAVSDIYKYGSKGGRELVNAVLKSRNAKRSFRYLYSNNRGIKEKIETIAKKVYGARGVEYGREAEDNIGRYEVLGFGKLPICMAKTHLSISHDPKLKGAPKDFILPVRDVRPSIGAGFLYALCGKTLTMPSLPSHPAGEEMDIDSKGNLIYVHSKAVKRLPG